MIKNIQPAGCALVILYFVSLDKPEFTQFAEHLFEQTTIVQCQATCWIISRGQIYSGTCQKRNEIISFLRDYCKQNKWEMLDWLDTQMKDFK